MRDSIAKLPDGWEWFKIRDICHIGRGRVISKNEIQNNPGDYPVYSSQTINDGIFGYLSTYDFDGEYVTWTTDGAYAGTVFYRNGKFNCTNVCGTLKAKNENIDMKLLSIILNNYTKPEVFIASGNPKLMNNVIAEIKIPFPLKLDEQNRIVKIIEKKLDAIEKIKIASDEQLSIIKGLFDSYVQKMVFNNEWRKYKLGDICTFTGGSQPPKSTFAYQPKREYVRLVQIQDFRKNNVAVYIPKETVKRVFSKDDVMIGRYGPPVFQILRGLEGAYNVALMKAETKDNTILDNNFLFYLLKERNIQNAVINQSQRSAGQSGVDKIFLERQSVRIPDIKIQYMILNKIEKFKERSFVLQNYLNEQSIYINALSQSILQKAFNGDY